MPKIQRLPDQVANQIAAGEVVERPSSVAKELIENALDAGARRIQVFASEGGRELVVVDDGEGMSAEDAVSAFERFATSKLRHPDDLWQLTTMGFRGEALPSIASVAKITCTTRERGREQGVKVAIEGGGVPAVTPAGCPEGTRVQVSELFYNTPARRKFLRSDATELAHVSEVVTALALSHPATAIALSVNERLSFDTAGAEDLPATARMILGHQLATQLLPIRAQGPHGEVSGLVSPPELVRGDRHRQWFFLNGRVVRHPTLARAVEDALAGHVPAGRHPLYVLALEVDPARVDVNVHPTKKEVRLADAQGFYTLVREAVARALLKNHPSFSPPDRPNPTPPSSVAIEATLQAYRPMETRVSEAPVVYQASLPAMAPVLAQGREDRFPWDQLRVLGQLHETFIVLEHPQGLYLLDQHNSHERYTYEHLAPAQLTSQELLLPMRLELDAAEAEALAAQQAPLEQLGFVIEPFGASTWAIRAVPGVLPFAEAEALIREVLGKAAEERFVHPAHRDDRWRVSLACHASTRAGDRLTLEQMQRIVELWRQCSQPFTCPHGRPTGFLLPMSDLLRRCLRS